MEKFVLKDKLNTSVFFPRSYKPQHAVREYFQQIVLNAQNGAKQGIGFDDQILHSCFTSADKEVVPGKFYVVRCYGIQQTTTTQEVRRFLRKEQAVLLGVHGLIALVDAALPLTQAVSFAPHTPDGIAAPVLHRDGQQVFYDVAISKKTLWTKGFELIVFHPA